MRASRGAIRDGNAHAGAALPGSGKGCTRRGPFRATFPMAARGMAPAAMVARPRDQEPRRNETMAETTPSATPAAPASAAKPAAPAAAAPAAPPKQLISPEMKQLYAQIQEQQKRLGWSDAKLCEFATQLLGPADPYKKLKIGTIEFLQRLRVGLLEPLLAAVKKAR
jgi:hypothetical protein